MKKTITTLFLCIMAIVATAQTANIEVCYTAHTISFKNGKPELANQYILLANTSESKFYSPRSEYIDSLNSTPEGMAKLKEMTRASFAAGDFDNAPRRDGSYYVVKSFPDSLLTYYDFNGLDKVLYEEPIAQWNWEVGDSTKMVFGYECVKATADYHGRRWTAWFAPEIPVQNGPWKLDGLPGLILEAEAEGGQYSFVATGIQQTSKLIGPIYLAAEYEHVTRIDFLKTRRAFLDNPLGQIDAQFGGAGMTVSAGGGDVQNMFAPASVADFLEIDYH